jgi:Protein of unknown function (DUF3108)
VRLRTELMALICLTALAINSAAHAAVPTFDVSYRAEVRGVYGGIARQWSEQGEAGQWVFRADVAPRRLARMFGAKRIQEESVLELADGALRTLSFHSTEGRDAETKVLATYDHATGVATVERERVREVEIPADALDRLGLQLALAHDLSEGGPREVYHVVTGAQLHEMRFEFIEETEIEVPAGTFPVVLYRRTEDRPGRSSLLWLAPSLDYIAVRIDEMRGDEVRSRLELDAIN